MVRPGGVRNERIFAATFQNPEIKSQTLAEQAPSPHLPQACRFPTRRLPPAASRRGEGRRWRKPWVAPPLCGRRPPVSSASWLRCCPRRCWPFHHHRVRGRNASCKHPARSKKSPPAFPWLDVKGLEPVSRLLSLSLALDSGRNNALAVGAEMLKCSCSAEKYVAAPAMR